MNFHDRYECYRTFFERELSAFCAGLDCRPSVLADSMRYSLQSGGKRVRPVLFFAGLDCFGLNFRAESDLALAIECIHTYSLIHDDLPAMDNDDFRRGRPSNHKVFGEANAILAGDGLLSVAFDLMLGAAGEERHLRAARILSEGAGAYGMIAGQSADLLYEGKEADRAALDFIYTHKTAKLIAAPLTMAAAIAGRNEGEMAAYGELLGVLFQLTDDILDEKGDPAEMGKTLGKDREEGKLTCVRLLGLERSEALADEFAARCLTSLHGVNGDTSFFKEFVSLVRNRRN